MIIECQTCHARFRLDESRIKGRGARVKCRKCGDSIVVLKDGDSAPVPPAPGEDGSFDLGSAVRDSSDRSPGPASPIGNLIPFPASPRPAEPFAAESSSPAPEAAEPEKDELDAAFARILSAGADASAPVEHEPPAVPENRPEQDFGALTLDFGPEEKLDLPSPAELEPPLEASPAPEPVAEFRGEGGFLISDSDTLDFLREKDRGAGSEAPQGIGDISLEISSTPVEGTGSFLRAPDAFPAPMEDRASPAPGGGFLEGNVTPPAAEPVVEAPPYREAEPAPAPSEEPAAARPVEPSSRGGSPAPEALRARSSAWPAVAAVLAILLAAGGYFGLTASGRKTLEGAVPGVAALWGEKPAAPSSKYDLRNVIGYYESGAASSRILVIKGQVANLSTADKSGIRVHAALLDNTDAVLVQQEVYAGNVLHGEAIRKGDRDSLSKALGNRFGEGLSNMHVAPGKAIPFMVVFFDAPKNIDSYKLEAKNGE